MGILELSGLPYSCETQGTWCLPNSQLLLYPSSQPGLLLRFRLDKRSQHCPAARSMISHLTLILQVQDIASLVLLYRGLVEVGVYSSSEIYYNTILLSKLWCKSWFPDNSIWWRRWFGPVLVRRIRSDIERSHSITPRNRYIGDVSHRISLYALRHRLIYHPACLLWR